MESARFGGQNRLFGAKPCPGPGAEFSNLVTSLVTGYVHVGSAVDSLSFSSELMHVFS